MVGEESRGDVARDGEAAGQARGADTRNCDPAPAGVNMNHIILFKKYIKILLLTVDHSLFLVVIALISPGVLWRVGVQKMHQGVMLSILRASTFADGIEESYNFQASNFYHICHKKCFIY